MGPYMWRRGLGVLFGVLLLGLVATFAFQMGAHHAVRDGSAAAGPYMYHWGGGFFLFPFLFFPLGFFLFFSLMRVLFWGGPRRYWGGPGMYGPGMYGPGRGERLEEWHRQAHAGESTTTPPGTPPAGSGPGAPSA